MKQQQDKGEVGGHQPPQNGLPGHAPVGDVVDNQNPQGAGHADHRADDQKHQIFFPLAELKQLIAQTGQKSFHRLLLTGPQSPSCPGPSPGSSPPGKG